MPLGAACMILPWLLFGCGGPKVPFDTASEATGTESGSGEAGTSGGG